MDLKRALLVTVWIVVGTIGGLIIVLSLLPFLGGALALPVLLLPPLAALASADRYRRANVYLPILERVSVSVLSVGALALAMLALATATEKELSGSWPVYSVVAILELVGIFAVLSLLTFKDHEKPT
jgi:hypothetical protein